MSANCPKCNRKMPAFPELQFVWFTGEVSYRGKSCKLPAAHLSLLEALIDAGERGISRIRLEDELWGDRVNHPSNKLLDVMLSQMRSKFRAAGVDVDVMSNGGQGERRRLTLVLGRPPLRRRWQNSRELPSTPLAAE
jgi:DNA-binding response OmpR family regulator